MGSMAKQESKNRIVLGITGGIAAYKAAGLLRLLIKQGLEVQAVMTEAATHFITPTTLQALSGKPVYTDQWDASVPNNMAHINLSRAADAIMIAPASADFIAKLAHGLADDLLSATCLARNCPLIIAPAMNREMWLNAATQRNVRQLIDDGVQVLGPDSGEQACGEEGMGRIRDIENGVVVHAGRGLDRVPVKRERDRGGADGLRFHQRRRVVAVSRRVDVHAKHPAAAGDRVVLRRAGTRSVVTMTATGRQRGDE